MIDTAEVETRLRATFEAVAATTPDNSDSPLHASPTELRRTPGRRRSPGSLVAATSLGLVVILTASALVLAAHRTGHGINVRTAQTTGDSTGMTSPTIPSVIRGTQQHLRISIGVPFPPTWRAVAGTTPHAYSVDNGPPFVVADIARMGNFPVPNGSPGACVSWEGTLPIGGQGIGTQMQCTPLRLIRAGSSHALFVVTEFPAHLHDTTVWAHLPAGTRYVSFAAEGVAHLWETPVDGVVAFTVGYPSQFNGSPNSVLRAYDSHGQLLQQVPACAVNTPCV